MEENLTKIAILKLKQRVRLARAAQLFWRFAS